jgi:hypothetical protein
MKHSVKTDKFASDLRVLDNLANAYIIIVKMGNSGLCGRINGMNI